jgi:predicted RND superfamily exporter protein
MFPISFVYSLIFPEANQAGLVENLHQFSNHPAGPQFGMFLFVGVIVVFAIITFFVQTGITYYLLMYENRTFKKSLKIMGIVWAITIFLLLLVYSPLLVLFIVSKFNVNG